MPLCSRTDSDSAANIGRARSDAMIATSAMRGMNVFIGNPSLESGRNEGDPSGRLLPAYYGCILFSSSIAADELRLHQAIACRKRETWSSAEDTEGTHVESPRMSPRVRTVGWCG